MPRLRLFPISLVVVWLTMLVSLSFAANAAAQEKGASEKPIVAGGPGGPSFTCGVCDDGYTPLNGWIFHGTGNIDAMFGFGGFLIPSGFNISHIHSPYWRLDFDIDDYTQNFVEEFTHPNTVDPDTHTVLDTDGPRFGTPSQFTKWTVRSNTTNAQGLFHGWDIEPILGTLTELTTADFWAMTVNPDSPERGAEVGTTDCSDYELANVYSKGNSINGANVVVWVAASSHHEPRHDGEEGGGQPANRKQMPGHEWVGIHISPRNAFDTTPVP
jgi:hypothetical protein